MGRLLAVGEGIYSVDALGFGAVSVTESWEAEREIEEGGRETEEGRG